MNKYKCGACGNQVGHFAKECPHCGCDLFIWYCPKCNRQLDNKTPFCPDCYPNTSTNRTTSVSQMSSTLPQFGQNEAVILRVFSVVALIMSLPPNIVGIIVSIFVYNYSKGRDKMATNIANAAIIINFVGIALAIILGILISQIRFP